MKPEPAPEKPNETLTEVVKKAGKHKPKSKKEVAAKAKNLDSPPTEAETSTKPDKKPADTKDDGLGEDILDALADD
jgi:hypothetical protein